MKKKGVWMFVLVALLALAGGAAYYFTNVSALAQETVDEPAITTSTVYRGDLIITASGSGELVPAIEVSVGFQSAGQVLEALVEVGDRVEVGQVLVRQVDDDARDGVAQAELNVRQAELEIAELAEEASAADLAAARASLSSAKANLRQLTEPPDDQELLAAQESLRSAQEALKDLLAGPDQDDVNAAKANLTNAEMNVRTAQAAYDKIAWQADVGSSQEAADLWAATTDYELAQADYEEVIEGATEDELADARAQVALVQADLNTLLEDPDADELAAAQSQVEQAQADLNDLLAGASTTDLEAAGLNLTQAQLDLESAQRALAETELLAPLAGTVTALEANAGEAVGTDTLVTLADLDGAQVQFWVEEADLSSVSVGNVVEVVFETLPDYAFPGSITQVDPMLVEVDGTAAVQAYADVDLTAHPITLLSGMNCEIEIVAGEARNALLVPLQALRELGPDSYAVFVVGNGGKLEMRPVEVGLRDFVNAEILSGLSEGEVISTGVEENTGSTPEGGGQEDPPDMGMRMLGG